MSEPLGVLFLILFVVAAAASIYLSITTSRRVQAGIDLWRNEEKQALEAELTRMAEADARLQLERWKQEHTQQIRTNAIQQSLAITKGKVTEHIVPYLPGFDLDPKDIRFLGTPIDLIAFNGLNTAEEVEIVFIEVKTGRSVLSAREKAVKKAVEEKRITWRVFNPDAEACRPLHASNPIGEPMRYWWVNQNQTYRHEVEGGYLWSPKRSANGARNPFYESMREVAPGDLIFSFMDTRIQAIGIAESYCWESPKPLEFGTAGQNWENIGWKVKVAFTALATKIRPKDHIDILRPLLPQRYSPLQPNGNGLRSVYLAELPADLAEVLIGLIGAEVEPLALAAKSTKPIVADDLDLWERRIEREVATDKTVPETDRVAIIRTRRGQGLFKDRVSQIESRCRITGVQNPVHLVASHCKPWRDSTNEERLNGENGLLLTLSIDHLFDRGFIGFEDNGRLIISPVAHHPSLERMGIDTAHPVNVGGFTSGQRAFLDFHRNAGLFQANRR